MYTYQKIVCIELIEITSIVPIKEKAQSYYKYETKNCKNNSTIFLKSTKQWNNSKKIDISDFEKVTTWTWIEIETRGKNEEKKYNGGKNKWRMNIGTTWVLKMRGTILYEQHCILHGSLKFNQGVNF